MSRSPVRGLVRVTLLPLALALAIGAAFVFQRAYIHRRLIPDPMGRVACAAQQVARPPGALPPLAFVRNGDIWTCSADGNRQRRIIRNGASPCWSPDHRQIAFARGGDVWIASADGARERRLTALAGARARAEGISTAWDPIENEVTFARPVEFQLTAGEASRGDDSPCFGSTLFAVPPAARLARRPAVRFGATDEKSGYQFSHYGCPAWSRSGKHLAFAVNGDIWVATRGHRRFEGESDAAIWRRRAGSWDQWEWEVARLAARAEYDAPNYRADAEIHAVTRLSWAPDECSLAYSMERIGGSGFNEVHLLRLRPTDATPIGLEVAEDTLLADDGVNPCFARDGDSIAYEARDAVGGVVVMSTRSKTRRRLAVGGEQPAW